MNRLFNRQNQTALQGYLKALFGLDKANSAFYRKEKVIKVQGDKNAPDSDKCPNLPSRVDR